MDADRQRAARSLRSGRAGNGQRVGLVDAPDKDFELDDPYELVAVRLRAPPGYDGPAAMARCFVEEFALMGWPPERILRLFQSDRFAGTHSVYEERGEAFIRGLIDDVFRGTGT